MPQSSWTSLPFTFTRTREFRTAPRTLSQVSVLLQQLDPGLSAVVKLYLQGPAFIQVDDAHERRYQWLGEQRQRSEHNQA